MLHRSYIYDPDRLARVEAHAARVQANPAYREKKKPLRPKRDLIQLWMAKIDRINAMGRWGWLT